MRYLATLLLFSLLACGCYVRPSIKYIEYDPESPFIMNAWYKAGSQYWFSTPSYDLAVAEFKRVTGHEVGRLPFNMYGFNVWADGQGMYFVTQENQ
jgi:hypothetical protein